MINRGLIGIYAFLIVNVFASQLSLCQSSRDGCIRLWCSQHNPCLYWDSPSQKEEILKFYEELNEPFNETSFNEFKRHRDSLFQHANWGGTLFEKEFRCYECLIDLLYNIYVENGRKSIFYYFENMKDSIELNIIYNNDTIEYNPRRIKLFCYLVDSVGSIIRSSEVVFYDKGFLYPFSPPTYPTYAIFKYNKRYYDIGWILQGDVMTIAILDYANQKYRLKSQGIAGEVKVTHARNWSMFSQKIRNIKIYSKENKRKSKYFIHSKFPIEEH